MTHELKILSQYYEEVKAGNKNFELRKNDRDYMEHDTVILKAWENGQYLDKEPLKREIAYILMDCPEYGLQDGFCIIGFRTEQEPILDKIRAEIEARLCDVVSNYTDGYRTAIQGVLAILDKYKAESEDGIF